MPMQFITDIFEKTQKVLNTLDAGYLKLTAIQKTSEVITQTILTSDYFSCDLYVDASWAAEHKNSIKSLFDYYNEKEAVAISDYLQHSIISSDYFSDPVSRAGSMVAIIIGTKSFLCMNGVMAQLKFNSGNYLFYIILNIDLEETELRKLKFNFNGKAIIIAAQDLSKEGFISYFENNILSKEAMKEIQTLSILKFIKPSLQEIYKNIIGDKKGIERLNLQKDKARLEINMINNDKSSLEKINRTKLEIQKNIRDIDRYIKKKYADLLLPNSGVFFRFVEVMNDKLKALETKDSADTKFPKIITSVSADYIRLFENSIKKILEKKFIEDRKEIENKINPILEQKEHNGTTQQCSSKPVSFPNQNKIINSYVELGKTYQGEIPKSNFQSYLMQIRQQTFFIFIMFALLSPIFQLPVLFIKEADMNRIQVLQSMQDKASDDPEKQKQLQEEIDKQREINDNSIRKRNSISSFTYKINLLIGLITLGFTIYFIIDLRKKIPVIKEEQMKKELERVKRELMIDGFRIFGDTVHDWLNSLNSWLVEIAEYISIQIEQVGTTTTNNRKTNIDQLENNFNLIVQEIAEKNSLYVETERAIISLITEYSQNITAFENKVSNILMRFRNNLERAVK